MHGFCTEGFSTPILFLPFLLMSGVVSEVAASREKCFPFFYARPAARACMYPDIHICKRDVDMDRFVHVSGPVSRESEVGRPFCRHSGEHAHGAWSPARDASGGSLLAFAYSTGSRQVSVSLPQQRRGGGRFLAFGGLHVHPQRCRKYNRVRNTLEIIYTRAQ